MLRDYPFNLDSKLLLKVFDQFDDERFSSDFALTLLDFKFLTPDSFIWRFLIDKKIFYLYAEDFIESLDRVRSTISSLTRDDSGFVFVKVKDTKHFEDTSPARSAVVYEPPEGVMEYAAESGFDFVFLVESEEDPSGAYFS